MKKFLILMLSLLLISNVAFCANKDNRSNNKQTVNVHKLTPRQKEVRKQMFNNAVNNGMNRAKAYNLYY